MESNENRVQRNVGKVAKEVERYTEKVPSSTFIGLAMGSVLLSATLALFGRHKSLANFVGLWAPTLILAGLYKKISQLKGEDIAKQMH
jgi:hypothetical protein